MFDENDACTKTALGLEVGVPGGRAKLRPPGEREEFALAPAARAGGPMRVARAEQSPWDTPPIRDSCGTVR